MNYEFKPHPRFEHHFYATSVAQWEVSLNPFELIARMYADNLPFTLWYVPTYIEASYQIREYAPQVEGAINIGTYDLKDVKDSKENQTANKRRFVSERSNHRFSDSIGGDSSNYRSPFFGSGRF